MPQVLAVNILGRFLLNNDRNIRFVLLFSPSSPSCLHSCLPPCLLHPSLPRLVAEGKLQAEERDSSQQAVLSLSSLITFPGDIPPQPHQKVTVGLLMLISPLCIRQRGGL